MITLAPAIQADQPVPFQPLTLADLATHPALPAALADLVVATAAARELATVAFATMTANFHDRHPTPFPALLFSMWFSPDTTHWVYAGGPYYLELSGAYVFVRPLPPPLPDPGGPVWVWGETDDAAATQLLLIQIQPTRDPLAGEIGF